FVGTDGVCATPSVRELLVDDLTFVSDSACAADADVLDPGFEWAARPTSTAPFWITSGGAELRVAPASARSGAAAAILSAPGPCAIPTLQGDVTIPAPSGSAGPALAFWYRTDSLANARIELGLTALSTPVSVPAAAGWTRVSACLNRRLSGRPD